MAGGSTELPPELQKFFLVTLGMPWPEGNDQALAALERAWREFEVAAEEYRDALRETGVKNLPAALEGETGKYFSAWLADDVVSGAEALEKSAEGLAKMARTAAADVVKAKVMMIAMAALALATIIHLLATLVGAAFVGLAMLTARQALMAVWRSLVAKMQALGALKLNKELAVQVVRAAGRAAVPVVGFAAAGAGIMGGLDLSIQLGQIVAGTRDELDGKSLVGSFVGGALGGAFAGLFHAGAVWVRGVAVKGAEKEAAGLLAEKLAVKGVTAESLAAAGDRLVVAKELFPGSVQALGHLSYGAGQVVMVILSAPPINLATGSPHASAWLGALSAFSGFGGGRGGGSGEHGSTGSLDALMAALGALPRAPALAIPDTGKITDAAVGSDTKPAGGAESTGGGKLPGAGFTTYVETTADPGDGATIPGEPPPSYADVMAADRRGAPSTESTARQTMAGGETGHTLGTLFISTPVAGSVTTDASPSTAGITAAATASATGVVAESVHIGLSDQYKGSSGGEISAGEHQALPSKDSTISATRPVEVTGLVAATTQSPSGTIDGKSAIARYLDGEPAPAATRGDRGAAASVQVARAEAKVVGTSSGGPKPAEDATAATSASTTATRPDGEGSSASEAVVVSGPAPALVRSAENDSPFARTPEPTNEHHHSFLTFAEQGARTSADPGGAPPADRSVIPAAGLEPAAESRSRVAAEVVTVPLPGSGNLLGAVAFVPRAAAGPVAEAVARLDVTPGTFVVVGRHRDGLLEVPSEMGSGAVSALPASLVPWSRMSRLLLVACDVTHPVVESVQRSVDGRPDTRSVRVTPYALEARLHVRANGTIVSGERPADTVVSLDPDSDPVPALITAETDRVLVRVRTGSDVSAVARQLRTEGVDQRPVLRLAGLDFRSSAPFAQALSTELGRPVDRRPVQGWFWIRHFPDGREPVAHSQLLPAERQDTGVADDADQLVSEGLLLADEALDVIRRMPLGNALLRRFAPPHYTWDAEHDLIDRDGGSVELHEFVNVAERWLTAWRKTPADADRNDGLRAQLWQWNRAVEELRKEWRAWARQEIRRYAEETDPLPIEPSNSNFVWAGHRFPGFAVSVRSRIPGGDGTAGLPRGWRSSPDRSAFRSPPAWFQKHGWSAVATAIAGSPGVDVLHVDIPLASHDDTAIIGQAAHRLARLSKIFEKPIFDLVAAAAARTSPMLRTEAVPNPYPSVAGITGIGEYNAGPHDHVEFGKIFSLHEKEVSFRLPYLIRDPGALLALSDLYAGLLEVVLFAPRAAERRILAEDSVYRVAADPAGASSSALLFDLLEILQPSSAAEARLLRLFAHVPDGHTFGWDDIDPSIGRGNVRMFPGPGADFDGVLRSLEALRVAPDVHLVVAERVAGGVLRPDGGRLPFEEFRGILVGREPAVRLGQTPEALAAGTVRGRLGLVVSRFPAEHAQGLADDLGVPLLVTMGEVVHGPDGRIRSDRHWIQFWPGDSGAVWTAHATDFGEALALTRSRFPSDVPALMESLHSDLASALRHVTVLADETPEELAGSHEILRHQANELSAAEAGEVPARLVLDRAVAAADLRTQLRELRTDQLTELFEEELHRSLPAGYPRLVPSLRASTVEPPAGAVQLQLTFPGDATRDSGRGDTLDLAGVNWAHEPGPEGTRILRSPLQPTVAAFAQLDRLAQFADDSGWPSDDLGAQIRVDAQRLLTPAERGRLLRLVKAFEAPLYRFGGAELALHEARPVPLPERGAEPVPGALTGDGADVVGFEVDHATGTEVVRLGFWRSSLDPTVLVSQTALSVLLIDAARDPLIDRALDDLLRAPRLVNDPDSGVALLDGLADLLELLDVSHVLDSLITITYANSTNWIGGVRTDPHGVSRLVRRENVSILPGAGESAGQVVERLYALDAQAGAHLVIGTPGSAHGTVSAWNGDELAAEDLADALVWSVPALASGPAPLGLVVPGGARGIAGPLAELSETVVLATDGDVRVANGTAVTDRAWIEFAPDGRSRDTGEADLAVALQSGSSVLPLLDGPAPRGDVVMARLPAGGALAGSVAFVRPEAVGAVTAAVARLQVEPGTFVLVGRYGAGGLQVPSGRSSIEAVVDGLSGSMMPWSRMSRLLLVMCDLTHPVVESVQRYVDGRPDAAGVRVVPFAMGTRLHVRGNGTIASGARPADAVESLDPEAPSEPALVRAETDRVRVHVRADSEVAEVADQLRAAGVDQRPVIRVSGLDTQWLPSFAQALSVELGRPVDRRTRYGRSWVRHFADGRPPYVLSWLGWTGHPERRLDEVTEEEIEAAARAEAVTERVTRDADDVVGEAREIAAEARELMRLLPQDQGLLQRVLPAGYTWGDDLELVDSGGNAHEVADVIDSWLKSWRAAPVDDGRTALLRSDLRQWRRAVDELRAGWRSWARKEILRYAEDSSWPQQTDDYLYSVGARYSEFAVSGRTLYPDTPAARISDWGIDADGPLFRSPPRWFRSSEWGDFADVMSGPLVVDAIHLGGEVAVGPEEVALHDRTVYDLARLGKVFEDVIFALAAAAAGPRAAANPSAVLPNPYPAEAGVAEIGGYNASPRDLIDFAGYSVAGTTSVTFRLPFPVREPAAIVALTNLFAGLYDTAIDSPPVLENLLREERRAHAAGAVPTPVSRTARFLDLLEVLRPSPEGQDRLLHLFAKAEAGQDFARDASDGSVGQGNVRVFPGPGTDFGQVLGTLEAFSPPRDTQIVLAERAPDGDSLLLADGGRLPFEEFVARMAKRDLAGRLGQTAEALADGSVRGRLGVAVSRLRPEQAQSLADEVGVPVLATAGEVVRRPPEGLASSRPWVQFWPGDAEAAWNTREQGFADALAAARNRFPSDQRTLLGSLLNELVVVQRHLNVMYTYEREAGEPSYQLLLADLKALARAPAETFAASFVLSRIAAAEDLRTRLRATRLSDLREALDEQREEQTPDDSSGRLLEGVAVTSLVPPAGRVEAVVASRQDLAVSGSSTAEEHGNAPDGRWRHTAGGDGTWSARLPMQPISSAFAHFESLGRELEARDVMPEALGTVIRVDAEGLLTPAERRRLLLLVKAFEAPLFRFGGPGRPSTEARPPVFPERGAAQDPATLPDDGANAVGFEVDRAAGTERIRLGFWRGGFEAAVLAAQTALSAALVQGAMDKNLDRPLDRRMREPRLVNDPVDADFTEAALVSELTDLLELLPVTREIGTLITVAYVDGVNRGDGPRPAQYGHSHLLRRETVTLVPEAGTSAGRAVEQLYALDAHPGAHLVRGTLSGDGSALRTWNAAELPIEDLADALAESVSGTGAKLALVVSHGAPALGGVLAARLGTTVLATRGDIRIENGIAVTDHTWIEFQPDGRARDTSEVDLTEALRSREAEPGLARHSFPLPLRPRVAGEVVTISPAGGPPGSAAFVRRPDGVAMSDGPAGPAVSWTRMSGRPPASLPGAGDVLPQPATIAAPGHDRSAGGAGLIQDDVGPARLPAFAEVAVSEAVRQLSVAGLDRGNGEPAGVVAGAFDDGAEARAWASAVEHEDLRQIWTAGSTAPVPAPWQHLAWNPVHLLAFGDGTGFLNVRGDQSGWLDGAQFGAGLAADAVFRRAAGQYAAAPLVITGLSGAPVRIAEQVRRLQAALRGDGLMRDIYVAPSHTALRPDGGFEVPPGRTFTLFSAPPPRPEEVRVDYHTSSDGEVVMASLPSADHLDQGTWASLLTDEAERTYYEWATPYQEDDGYDSDGIAADGSRLVVQRETPWARLGSRPFYLAGGGNANGFQAALSPPGGDTFAADPRFMHDLIMSRGLLANVPPRRREGLALLFCDVGSGGRESVGVRLMELLRPSLGTHWAGFAATRAIVLPTLDHEVNPMVIENSGQFVVYFAARRAVQAYRGAEAD
ncbi:hypothetical protein DMC64_20365 [Amycolatopsis sp. WAC 04197]|uniref:WXG100-like domain-containing protein n=1 Tax=Amycolatopsis sp. WAC 04197 TaxID=2203199 RepID=UPI000F78E1E9|nr:hypothetical protein [Amycolatopsis sp. WAC 04197]RSN45194.1 hypothetical protein DMC64_20365 [Amycolatopsis sp. WAC 04197]